MKRLVLSIVVLGLMASPAMATYMVKQAAWAPTGPTDPIWNSANQMAWGVATGGSYPPSSICVGDARVLWDGTNFYFRIGVTDQAHYDSAAVGTNAWNMDCMEFYLNPHNTTSTVYNDGAEQFQIAIMNDGSPSLASAAITAGRPEQIAPTLSEAAIWEDSNFTADGSNTTNGGNYAIQITLPWVGSLNGTLSFTTAPTAGTLMKLDAAICDADGGPGRIADITTTDAGGGFNFQWTNPNEWGVAQLDATMAPEPATLTLLVLGGIGMLVRRRRHT